MCQISSKMVYVSTDHREPVISACKLSEGPAASSLITSTVWAMVHIVGIPTMGIRYHVRHAKVLSTALVLVCRIRYKCVRIWGLTSVEWQQHRQGGSNDKCNTNSYEHKRGKTGHGWAPQKTQRDSDVETYVIIAIWAYRNVWGIWNGFMRYTMPDICIDPAIFLCEFIRSIPRQTMPSNKVIAMQ